MSQRMTFTPLNLRNFWRNVDVRAWDECWRWTGATSRDGYGVISVGGKQLLASHVALMISGQPRPAAPMDHALHGDCSDPGCVNFRHLRWGSEGDNAADRERLQRSHPVKGADHHSTTLTDDDVREIRNSPEKGYEIAARFGISRAGVSLIRNRKVWKHL